MRAQLDEMLEICNWIFILFILPLIAYGKANADWNCSAGEVFKETFLPAISLIGQFYRCSEGFPMILNSSCRKGSILI